jgi:ATP-dependent DNA helicase RecQ
MNLSNAKNALKKYFGYDHFRPLQADIIQAIYDQKDALVLMPTGGGKSICFQIPAITMEGTCMVISPLISLMKDQVEALRANGIQAAFLNSSLTQEEQRKVEDDLFYGRLDLIYVSPEKMCSREFLPLLKKVNVNLFAIDEAHCISSWGHDFRPEYARLKFLKNEFPNVPTVALTATADRMTRKDIVEQLNLNNAQTFLSSFDRPNLSLEVRPGRKRIEQILEFIKKRPNQSGVIYCLSRKGTEDICAKLLKEGIKSDYYHAGMSSQERSRVQEAFIKDEIPVITATVAFGMGIDKSNVRWIIHYNLPKNIESYYQEIGRAGRDGADADTLLFYSFQDVVKYRDFIEESELREIKLAKLDRMYQFATSVACRRKVLLNYFSENMRHNCGNCDVCKNPPTVIDGTVITQKALSAIARLNENVPQGMLIDVLRGSRRQEIIQNGFHNIKTYGAGSDVSWKEWMRYLEQMLNQGLIEIAYEDNNKVRLTEGSKAVLFDGDKVQLVKAETIEKRKDEAKKKADAATRKKFERQRVRDEMFEYLRKLRLEVARKKGVPPYIVFSDATLEEMAATKPKTMEEMNQVSGVGEAKLRQYGRLFIDAIQAFILEKKKEGISTKGGTHLESFQMYKRGMSIEQIAQERALAPMTIGGHLIKMYMEGEAVKLTDFVSKKEVQQVLELVKDLGEPFGIKEVYEGLNEEVPYYKIRFALAYRERMLKV